MTEFQIAETYFLQHFDFVQDIGHVFKEFYCLIDGHVEHISDAFAFEAHFERFAVVAFAVAGFARHIHIGEKVHLDGFVAIAAAGFAATTFDVEGETTGLVGTYLSFRKIDKEGADVVEHASVGSRIGARCATERTLIHCHHFVDVFQSFYLVISEGFAQRMIDVLREQGVEGVVDERGFSRSRHSRYANQCAEGEGGSDIAQVVAFCSDELELFAVAFATLGYRNEIIAIEIACGEGVALKHLGWCALKHHFSAFASSSRTDVHHIVCGKHHVFVVLHHHHCVARVAELSERMNEAHVVALVKSDGGFVEDVEHIDQLRTNLCGKANALTFTTGECHRCA